MWYFEVGGQFVKNFNFVSVPAAYSFFAGTVPAVYSLFAGTVPAYNLCQKCLGDSNDFQPRGGGQL